MGFNEISDAAAKLIITGLGEPVSYQPVAGGAPVLTYAAIDLGVQVFSAIDTGVGEFRTEIAVLIADVGTPSRGDTITTEDAVVYTVQTLLREENDGIVARVTAK